MKGSAPEDAEVAMTRKPSDAEPFSALAFKIMTDPVCGHAHLHQGVQVRAVVVLW